MTKGSRRATGAGITTPLKAAVIIIIRRMDITLTRAACMMAGTTVTQRVSATGEEASSRDTKRVRCSFPGEAMIGSARRLVLAALRITAAAALLTTVATPGLAQTPSAGAPSRTNPQSAAPSSEPVSPFVDSEGVPVPQRQARHCASRADDHTAHWYKDAREQDLYCPGGPANDPVVLLDAEKKPVRRSELRNCGSAEAGHEAHWWTDKQERERFCEGGASRGGSISSERSSDPSAVVARDAKGGPVLRRELQHCGLEYDHPSHWRRSRGGGHDHWCPGGPHRYERRY